MNAYKELHYTNVSREQREILIALLNEFEPEGFEEGDDELKVFFTEDKYNDASLDEVHASLQIKPSVSDIEPVNWNQAWESNFEPVVVDEFVAVRAGFHDPINQVEHEIVITPKMSFGTGHHATTYMMLQQMRAIDFKDRHVFDFGTGTGVLAILAHRLGAASVRAIDNDPWSIDNTRENMETNNAEAIILERADDAGEGYHYDVILANINRNVLLDNMHRLSAQLNPGGTLLLSGLLEEDETVIVDSAAKNGLGQPQRFQRGNWICIRFSAA
ncbi:50S ribosomal protein L11 methyltransferase [Nostoc ellipsosporum NOK]|nr:50S ribosomal protein L11 methyltransferase [Nostoc ellipsosporum NOK]